MREGGLFLLMVDGKGVALRGPTEGQDFDESGFNFEDIKQALLGEDIPEAESIELDDKRRLSIATLGALRQHPRIAGLSPVLRRLVPQLLHAGGGAQFAYGRAAAAVERARRQSWQRRAVHGA